MESTDVSALDDESSNYVIFVSISVYFLVLFVRALILPDLDSHNFYNYKSLTHFQSLARACTVE
jgi:hypothetical protein